MKNPKVNIQATFEQYMLPLLKERRPDLTDEYFYSQAVIILREGFSKFFKIEPIVYNGIKEDKDNRDTST